MVQTRTATGILPEGGWLLECAIPLKSLGIKDPPKKGDVWGFQIGRKTKAAGYCVYSAFWTGPYGIRKPEAFGHLHFSE